MFQSTPPEWGATPVSIYLRLAIWSFNPRPPSGERPPLLAIFYLEAVVSIHAPRVGSDKCAYAYKPQRRVSIHAPRVGSDVMAFIQASIMSEFQSTPPEWGATCNRHRQYRSARCFNPRPPSGERPVFDNRCKIHILFQSTPPEWGATLSRWLSTLQTAVSIHAPRVGSDKETWRTTPDKTTFQSTPPEWGATVSAYCKTCRAIVSIHAPRVGSDLLRYRARHHDHRFNPRPPSGERHHQIAQQDLGNKFQSTPPEWGATDLLFVFSITS